ncbi:PTS fructose transporter subunit IIBC [Terasakiispira papahanaumokuakeensis]|uniref:protein-N(pi)-phosphohistidine--D-fructose phosphotransferase n=1 Tax=Terasakiispira papahanaumokuakeensis TaxID=197479 RepID=A0A1E2V7M0_9GAMM|nr:PTS fructose-like transporter subunit IIB [Terasakiispira papahanaumokuakeensis]ODC03010.1 PTS fructose transporter subunit IIBC [Terasakiispira papahanaumokuakeensis]
MTAHNTYNVILITQCPSGLATSFLAARRLEHAAQRRGWQCHVEMHSELAPVDYATPEQIDRADLIIVAADHLPQAERFQGQRLYQAPIAAALPDPDVFLDQAEQAASPFEWTETSSTPTDNAAVSAQADRTHIVAVTACPTGVAHTFMAAEALSEAGKTQGYSIRVETQGSVGAQDQLTADEIAAADVVILACDIEVDPTRFAGKRVYRTSTGQALKKPQLTIESALKEATFESAEATTAQSQSSQSFKEKGLYKHLLTGVSFMLPMVVAGGLLIALSFVFGIEAFKEKGTLAAALMQIGGGTAFKLMIPVLAGYIAYSIADRPGIAPGMIGGLLAADIGTGFIGGILAGFLAGYVAQAITRWVKLPSSVESLKPILIIPLIASLVTGLVMIYIIGGPVAKLNTGLNEFLASMDTANAVLLGVLLGAMMCFDLGGPVNKAAYTFGVGLLSSQTYAPMAAIMASGMVPAIGMGIASFVARHKFSKPEQEAGKASLILGFCFISEGAIPFAAKDPLRVIPCCIAGGALTGALSMLAGAKLMAPHGGIFVLLIPNAINPVLPYIGAILAGSLVTGLSYAFAKRGAATVAVET